MQSNHSISAKFSPTIHYATHITPRANSQEYYSHSYSISKSLSKSHSWNLPNHDTNTSSANTTATPSANTNIQHIIHIYNFWMDSYVYKVMSLPPPLHPTLDNTTANTGAVNATNASTHKTPGSSSANMTSTAASHHEDASRYELALDNIPTHSLSLYAISISLHPLLPKYIGSNLHWTCNQEINRMYLIGLERMLQQENMNETCTQYANQVDEVMDYYCTYALPRSSSRRHTNHNNNSMNMSIDPNANESSKYNNNNNNSKQQRSPVIPIINTVCIELKDHMLINNNSSTDDERQYLYIFLPINIKRIKSFGHLLGHLEMTGSVFPSPLTSTITSHNNTIPPIRPPSFVHHQYHKAHHNHHQQIVEVVAYIEESTCRVAGYVYKIYLTANRASSPALDGVKDGLGIKAEDYLVLHWISDVEEIAQPVNIQQIDSLDLFG